MRLDPDVIRWLKRTGRGYQSHMGGRFAQLRRG